MKVRNNIKRDVISSLKRCLKLKWEGKFRLVKYASQWGWKSLKQLRDQRCNCNPLQSACLPSYPELRSNFFPSIMRCIGYAENFKVIAKNKEEAEVLATQIEKWSTDNQIVLNIGKKQSAMYKRRNRNWQNDWYQTWYSKLPERSRRDNGEKPLAERQQYTKGQQIMAGIL